MESKAKLLGHSIHQMLVIFPAGLFFTSVIFDILYLFTGTAVFPAIAYYIILIGVIGGLAAAVFGGIDWLAIPANTRAKRIGAYHGALNIIVTLLFAAGWLLRRGATDYQASTLALIISFAAATLLAVAAWFGGELVDRLRVGVDDGAHLNAPSSLSGKPAAQNSTAQRSTSK
jgi:uncharacterized membrane protein